MIVELHRRFPDRYLLVLRLRAEELGTVAPEALGLDLLDVELDQEDADHPVISAAFIFQFGAVPLQTGSTEKAGGPMANLPMRDMTRDELEQQHVREAAAIVRDAISRAQADQGTSLEGTEV